MTPLEILEPQLRPVDEFAFGPGVYFLVDDNDIAYVGCSENVWHRVLFHVRSRTFTRALWLSLPAKVHCHYEGAFIRALRPIGNRTAPPSRGYDAEILDGFGIAHLMDDQRGFGPHEPRAYTAIRTARIQSGMSQQALATAVGTTRQAVHWWEIGQSTPTVENLRRAAVVLGVPVESLFGSN